jgi:hypothetical protein
MVFPWNAARGASSRRESAVNSKMLLAVAFLAVSPPPAGFEIAPATGGASECKPAPPSEEEQAGAEKRIRAVHKDAFAAARTEAGLKGLARKLLEQGRAPGNDPASRYVLLREARDAAARAGDARGAFLAIRELRASFAIDSLLLEKAAVATVMKAARSPEALEGLAEACIETAGGAVAIGDYGEARRMTVSAAAAARRAKNASLVTVARELGSEIAQIEKKHQEAAAALRLVESEPENAAACTQAGRFLCLYKREWKTGLPRLAGGSDPTLHSLGAKELAPPAEPKAQLQLAEEWWLVGEAASGIERASCRLRAARWYAEAAMAPSGGPSAGLGALERERVLQRLEALAGESPLLRPGAEQPPGFVAVRFQGSDLYGWQPLSGNWRVVGGQITTEGRGSNIHLRSAVRAAWGRIDFEFRGGNPGLYFSASSDATSGPGVNLDSDPRNNGEIRRPVRADRWYTLRVEQAGGEAQFFLDEEKVYSAYLPQPSYILVKAHQGTLLVRKLQALGYNP